MARETSDVFDPTFHRAASRLGHNLAERLEWLRATPFWAVSALVHLIILLALFVIIVREDPRPPTDEGPTVVNLSPPRKPPPLTRPEIDPSRQAATERRDRLPGILPKEPKNSGFEDGKETTKPRKGDPLGKSPRGPKDSLSDLAFATPIGPGPSAGRTQGVPDGEIDGDLPLGSPTPDTDDALDRALDWLRRHQDPDGSWKARDFTERCSVTCRNADSSRHGDGRGSSENDVGVTGLALLAFVGTGHTHRGGVYEEHVACVRRAVQHLKGIQARSSDPAVNGRFGLADGESWIYGHAIATLALAELLVISGDDVFLREAVEEAVKLCLHAQNNGFGWRYGIKPGDNDTSITGWMVLALKTASRARLAIPKEDFERALGGAMRWVERATAQNGRTGYQAPGDDGSRLSGAFPEPYPFSKEMSAMTAAGVLCRLLSGEGRESKAIRSGVDILIGELPRWQDAKGRSLSRVNFYYWYYGSYALFLYGGKAWERWNESLVACLVHSQRTGATDELGSWDPIDEWGPAGGRVYATALGALTLEVYYRYRRLRK